MVRLSTAVLLHGLVAPLSVVQAQTGVGIVGYGISYYDDLCCQACHDSLSELYLSCTTFSEEDHSGMEGMDMGSDGDMAMTMIMGTTSDECRLSSTPWLQTMAYCIRSRCDADNYSAENQAKCFSALAVAGASEPTLQQSLPPSAPTTELAEDAEWLNTTSLVNGALYYATYGTYGNFAASERYHSRYA